MKIKSKYICCVLTILLFVSFLNAYQFAVSETAIPKGVKKYYSYGVEDKTIMPVKNRLYDLGYCDDIDVSSSWLNNRLKTAVMEFQKNNGLTVDGKINTKLYEVLFSNAAVRAKSSIPRGKTSELEPQSLKKTQSTNIRKPSTLKKDKEIDAGTVIGIIVAIALILFFLIYIFQASFGPKLFNVQTELARIDNMNGVSFESWCASLLTKCGYHNVKVTKATGDYGADIVCYHNGDKTVVQCKRYSNKVNLKPIQEILGGKHHYGASEMMVITNSYFTDSARQLAKESGVVLWDRRSLINIMNSINTRYSKEQKTH